VGPSDGLDAVAMKENVPAFAEARSLVTVLTGTTYSNGEHQNVERFQEKYVTCIGRVV
jgi:hypothetical protein